MARNCIVTKVMGTIWQASSKMYRLYQGSAAEIISSEIFFCPWCFLFFFPSFLMLVCLTFNYLSAFNPPLIVQCLHFSKINRKTMFRCLHVNVSMFQNRLALVFQVHGVLHKCQGLFLQNSNINVQKCIVFTVMYIRKLI